jgi:8-oxo-dGTP pyrophosphatase MutT (NUDIX family)
MSRVSYNFCNNCGKTGHAFHHCKQPITSIGIIVFRYNDEKKKEYLLIRRKDSLGYVDFIRGKYPLYNPFYIQNIIDEMTIEEKNRLINYDFDYLWKSLWGEKIGIQYRNEEKTSREKFDALILGVTSGSIQYSLQSLINNSKTSWKETEWGFPKGRRNFQEKDLSCALREFEEETGYQKSSLKIVQNLIPFEEIFTGSNYKSYKHKYYLAKMDNSIRPVTEYQETEVSKISWMTIENAEKNIRPYNLEKIDVIIRTENLLNNYRLY